MLNGVPPARFGYPTIARAIADFGKHGAPVRSGYVLNQLSLTPLIYMSCSPLRPVPAGHAGPWS